MGYGLKGWRKAAAYILLGTGLGAMAPSFSARPATTGEPVYTTEKRVLRRENAFYEVSKGENPTRIVSRVYKIDARDPSLGQKWKGIVKKTLEEHPEYAHLKIDNVSVENGSLVNRPDGLPDLIYPGDNLVFPDIFAEDIQDVPKFTGMYKPDKNGGTVETNYFNLYNMLIGAIGGSATAGALAAAKRARQKRMQLPDEAPVSGEPPEKPAPIPVTRPALTYSKPTEEGKGQGFFENLKTKWQEYRDKKRGKAEQAEKAKIIKKSGTVRAYGETLQINALNGQEMGTSGRPVTQESDLKELIDDINSKDFLAAKDYFLQKSDIDLSQYPSDYARKVYGALMAKSREYEAERLKAAREQRQRDHQFEWLLHFASLDQKSLAAAKPAIAKPTVEATAEDLKAVVAAPAANPEEVILEHEGFVLRKKDIDVIHDLTERDEDEIKRLAGHIGKAKDVSYGAPKLREDLDNLYTMGSLKSVAAGDESSPITRRYNMLRERVSSYFKTLETDLENLKFEEDFASQVALDQGPSNSQAQVPEAGTALPDDSPVLQPVATQAISVKETLPEPAATIPAPEAATNGSEIAAQENGNDGHRFIFTYLQEEREMLRQILDEAARNSGVNYRTGPDGVIVMTPKDGVVKTEEPKIEIKPEPVVEYKLDEIIKKYKLLEMPDDMFRILKVLADHSVGKKGLTEQRHLSEDLERHPEYSKYKDAIQGFFRDLYKEVEEERLKKLAEEQSNGSVPVNGKRKKNGPGSGGAPPAPQSQQTPPPAASGGQGAKSFDYRSLSNNVDVIRGYNSGLSIGRVAEATGRTEGEVYAALQHAMKNGYVYRERFDRKAAVVAEIDEMNGLGFIIEKYRAGMTARQVADEFFNKTGMRVSESSVRRIAGKRKKKQAEIHFSKPDEVSAVESRKLRLELANQGIMPSLPDYRSERPTAWAN